MAGVKMLVFNCSRNLDWRSNGEGFYGVPFACKTFALADFTLKKIMFF